MRLVTGLVLLFLASPAFAELPERADSASQSSSEAQGNDAPAMQQLIEQERLRKMVQEREARELRLRIEQEKLRSMEQARRDQEAQSGLPAEFQELPITNAQRNMSVVLHAINQSSGIEVLVSALNHQAAPDLIPFALTQRANMEGKLANARSSVPASLTINGHQVVSYKVSGNFGGTNVSYLTTIVDRADQVISITAWSETEIFIQRKFDIENLVRQLIDIPVQADKPAETPSVAQRLEKLNTLYKSNLIDKKDFEDKKQEILKSM